MRHHSRRPTAFTLVELLVVIAIIGVLMGLLLPAVQSAREAGRRTTCQNNQYQLALAAVRFNDTNGFLPGWRNSMVITSATIFPSWPVVMLPFVERSDIFRTWQTGVAAATSAANQPYVSLFVCPSSPPDSMTSPVLAYAGNCGTGNSAKSNGVMVDNASPGTPSSRIDLDEISSEDGTSMTLLLSEKCITGPLVPSQWSTLYPTTSVTFTFQGVATAVPGFGLVGVAAVPRIINNTGMGPPGQASQPSSNHPGGAVAAFCDGRTIFLKDSLSQSVYGRLVTSDGATVNGTAANAVWGATAGPLSEGDFQ